MGEPAPKKSARLVCRSGPLCCESSRDPFHDSRLSANRYSNPVVSPSPIINIPVATTIRTATNVTFCSNRTPA